MDNHFLNLRAGSSDRFLSHEQVFPVLSFTMKTSVNHISKKQQSLSSFSLGESLPCGIMEAWNPLSDAERNLPPWGNCLAAGASSPSRCLPPLFKCFQHHSLGIFMGCFYLRQKHDSEWPCPCQPSYTPKKTIFQKKRQGPFILGGRKKNTPKWQVWLMLTQANYSTFLLVSGKLTNRLACLLLLFTLH